MTLRGCKQARGSRPFMSCTNGWICCQPGELCGSVSATWGESLGPLLHEVECALSREPMPLLNASDWLCDVVNSLRCTTLALGKMILYLTNGIALLPQPSWRIHSVAAKNDKWAHELGCGDADAWQCLFGQPQQPS